MPATTAHRSGAYATWLPWLLPLGGVLLALSFPNELIPGLLGDRPPAVFGWLALFPLMWAVLVMPPRDGARAVGWYGLLFMLVSLSWLRLFGFLPWLLLAAYLALTPLLSVLITRRMRLPRWLTPLGFALAWTGLEWLRGQGMFGLAWSELGASQIEGFPARMAALGGIPLISFLMLWVVGVIVQYYTDRTAPRRHGLLAMGALVLCLLGGWWQTQQTVGRWQANPHRQLIAVVQPSTQKGLTPEVLVKRSTPQERQQRLDMLTALTLKTNKLFAAQGPDAKDSRMIIWSESAIPNDPQFEAMDVPSLCLSTRSYLLIGAPAWPPPKFTIRNSAYLYSPAGREFERYDKIHLVPFGEFVPLRKLVARYYTVRSNDIQPGEARTILHADGHPFGAGICFESIFPYIARDYARKGASLLVFITNDAWFHQTSAVRQHFNHARFRALETGLPVARTASTGISGFIAPDGRILDEIPTYAESVKVFPMPDGVPGTLNTRAGWLFGPACLLLTLVLFCAGIVRSHFAKSSNNPTSV
ncbi:MAG: apolipoprotein N-acyltransferase [Armatimonadota bacterium]